MTPDSPGVLAAEGAAYIVPTGPNVASMRAVLPVMASLATRLAAGEPIGSAEDEGYLPRGLRRNVRSDRTGRAARDRPAAREDRRRRADGGRAQRGSRGAAAGGRPTSRR